MDFELTEEQELIRSTVREFAETVLAPRAREMDEKAEFPWEEIKKMAEQGYLGAQIPKEYGGSELDTVSYAILIEEISRVVCGIGLTLQIHNSACAQPCRQFTFQKPGAARRVRVRPGWLAIPCQDSFCAP